MHAGRDIGIVRTQRSAGVVAGAETLLHLHLHQPHPPSTGREVLLGGDVAASEEHAGVYAVAVDADPCEVLGSGRGLEVLCRDKKGARRGYSLQPMKKRLKGGLVPAMEVKSPLISGATLVASRLKSAATTEKCS